jgi:hypothetical protein
MKTIPYDKKGDKKSKIRKTAKTMWEMYRESDDRSTLLSEILSMQES